MPIIVPCFVLTERYGPFEVDFNRYLKLLLVFTFLYASLAALINVAGDWLAAFLPSVNAGYTAKMNVATFRGSKLSLKLLPSVLCW